jgi:glycosyltransferase involved in cell wall biosynthesis
MDSTGRSYEIVVVDDGSSDGTFEVLREHKKSMAELVAVRFASNQGQTAAFDAGFRTARGKIIATMDADLQNDPADIPRLIALVGQWDVVCGYRQKREDSVVRRISSRIANGVRNRLTRETIRDVGCSLRAFRAECARGLKLFEGMHRFLPTLFRLDGFTVAEVPVNHRPRKLGKSKYGVFNRLFKALRDLFAVRWMQRRWLRYKIKETLR